MTIVSENDIDELDRELSKLESKLSEAKGRVSVNKSRLKKEFNLDDKDGIAKFISESSDRLDEIDSKIEEKYSIVRNITKNINV